MLYLDFLKLLVGLSLLDTAWWSQSLYIESMKRIPYFYLAIDLISVIIFAFIGRMSHEHGLTLIGIFSTAAPFLVATALGFIVGRFITANLALQGLIVWLFAVNLGMILRVAFGGGFAISFYIVTTIALFVLIVLWRLVLRKRLP